MQIFGYSFIFYFQILFCPLKCKHVTHLNHDHELDTRMTKLEEDVTALMSDYKLLQEVHRNLHEVVTNQQWEPQSVMKPLEIAKETDDNKDRKRRQLPGTNTAFYAYMSATETSPGPHHTLIFDYAVTNIGANYNRYTGIFSATQSGVYVFSYSISPYSSAVIPVEIVKNSDVIGSTYAHPYSSYRPTVSSTVVVAMNAGDVCYIRTNPASSTSGNIFSGTLSRTSFAGWMLA